jgi:hypothetical protein
MHGAQQLSVGALLWCCAVAAVMRGRTMHVGFSMTRNRVCKCMVCFTASMVSATRSDDRIVSLAVLDAFEHMPWSMQNNCRLPQRRYIG